MMTSGHFAHLSTHLAHLMATISAVNVVIVEHMLALARAWMYVCLNWPITLEGVTEKEMLIHYAPFPGTYLQK